MKEKLDFEVFKSSDMQKKKEIVRSLGIYELRGLARVLGIKSPTTKVREVLIENILLTLVNGKPLDPQVSRKGRPYKKLAHIDSIVSMIANNPEQKDVSFDALASFNQEVPVFTFRDSRIVTACGVLRSGKLSTYFIDLKRNFHVFISEEFVEQKGLVTGDYVEAEAYKINDSNQYFSEKLTKINGVSFEGYRGKPQHRSAQVLPSEFFHAGDMKVLKGGRNVIINSEPLFLDTRLKELLSNLSRDEADNIFLGLDLCFEDEIFVSSKNFVSFSSQYLSSSSAGFDRILDAINLVSRLSEQGRNVNLFIYDAGLLLSVMDQKFLSEGRTPQESATVLKKIVSLAEAREEGTTTTLIASIKQSDIENSVLKNDLIRISVRI